MGIIILLGFGLYFQSSQFEFLLNFDDDRLIIDGLGINDLSLKSWKILFTENVYGLYHPLTSLSWLLEQLAIGNDPFYFHLNNVLFHLCNGTLVFAFIRLRFQDKTLALLVASLFILHPIHVENVSWLSSRKDLLYVFFFVLGLIQYHHFQKKQGIFNLALVYLFFIAALLSKANAVVFPAVLLLMDWQEGKQNWGKQILKKIPLFALSGALAYLTIQAQEDAGFISAFPIDYTWLDRIVFLMYSLGHYPLQLLIPFDLSPKYIYPMKDGSLLPLKIYVQALISIAVLAFCMIKWKKNAFLLFSFLFFYLLLAPVLKLIPTGNDLVSNRYAYLASIGLYLIIAQFFLEKNKSVLWLGFLAWLGILSYVNYQYQSTYESSYQVWTAAIKGNEGNSIGEAIAYNERGQILMKQGGKEQAIKDINKAIQLDSRNYRAYLNRANYYELNGKLDLALNNLNKAENLSDKPVDALRLRGVIHGKMGNPELSVQDFNTAIGWAPNRADLFNNRGIANSILGNSKEAIDDFNHALSLNPKYTDAQFNRANALIESGNLNDALKDLTVLNQSNENNLSYAYALAKTYYLLEEDEQAVQTLRVYKSNQSSASIIANRLLSDGLAKQSLEYFTIAMGQAAIRDKSLYQRSQAYRVLGEYENALDDLFAILEAVPNPQVFYEIAENYLALNELNKACEFWNEALQREHPNAQVQLDQYCSE